ncbi:hypothetical protein VNO77_19261 [Canavalia gladiata]|uniref:Uncharacterized protein n=1 Tax=Canavalia gladiata TaxID=3824 RepID=A0AAN9LME4_CANGL
MASEVGEKDVSVRRYDEASSSEECMMRYVRRTSIAKRLPMLESERSLSHGHNDPTHALVTIEVSIKVTRKVGVLDCAWLEKYKETYVNPCPTFYSQHTIKGTGVDKGTHDASRKGYK